MSAFESKFLEFALSMKHLKTKSLSLRMQGPACVSYKFLYVVRYMKITRRNSQEIFTTGFPYALQQAGAAERSLGWHLYTG